MQQKLHHVITQPSEGNNSAGYATVAAGAKLIYSPSRPVQVVRWGFLCTTTVNDGTNALKLTGDVRPTIGSASGQVTGATATVQATQGYNAAGQPALFTDTAGGSLTLTASASQVAAGAGVYHNVNPQAAVSPSTIYPAVGGVDTQLVIYPGQEFVITSQATAPSAGNGVYFVEVEELAFQGNQVGPATNQSPALSPSNANSSLTQFSK